MLLPIASIDRLIRKAGAYRVSKEAAEELASHLEEIAIEIGREAVKMSEHAGRKTVRADDIKLAQKRVG